MWTIPITTISSFPGYRELTKKKKPYLPSNERQDVHLPCMAILHWGHNEARPTESDWALCPLVQLGLSFAYVIDSREQDAIHLLHLTWLFWRKRGHEHLLSICSSFSSVSTSNTDLICKTSCCKEQTDKLHLNKKSRAEDKQHPQSVQEQQLSSTICASQNNVRMVAMQCFWATGSYRLQQTTCLPNIIHSNATKKQFQTLIESAKVTETIK